MEAFARTLIVQKVKKKFQVLRENVRIDLKLKKNFIGYSHQLPIPRYKKRGERRTEGSRRLICLAWDGSHDTAAARARRKLLEGTGREKGSAHRQPITALPFLLPSSLCSNIYT